ncbi:uncharacterized protein LOC119362335 [Triticum dicoccoides]|uniref:uncharacterized protein LOC119362335 n=1 Tax=Triticum dicoccoides TaxID=85692 RepID=UPI00188F7D7F|nr:uncharacterized protein LOC119362335 [Triticum dicoccoides]
MKDKLDTLIKQIKKDKNRAGESKDISDVKDICILLEVTLFDVYTLVYSNFSFTMLTCLYLDRLYRQNLDNIPLHSRHGRYDHAMLHILCSSSATRARFYLEHASMKRCCRRPIELRSIECLAVYVDVVHV